MKQPTRPLLRAKPLRYVPAAETDIRRTFRRFRLLAYLRHRHQPQPDEAGPATAGAILSADRFAQALFKPQG